MKIKSLISGLAAILVAAMATISCTQEIALPDTLQSATSFTFDATDNADVTFTVISTAEKWEYTAPQWVVAERVGSTLIINVQDNDGEARVGRIVITSSDADPIRITVYQKEFVVVNNGPKLAVKFNNKAEKESFQIAGGAAKGSVSVSIEGALDEDLVVEIGLDLPYVTEYSFIKDAVFTAIPEESVEFSATELVIPAGKSESEPVEVTIDGGLLEFGEGYLVPLVAKVKSGAGVFAQDAKRINYVLTRSNPKEGKVKNALFFEVNDCNPLNALEYLLDDGNDTPFFDVVILFAANINYNKSLDVVYLNNNPNVQALLDNSETYIQPLRKKGIKVQLGLLGNHDESGLCQLSDWGAREWAKEVAEAVRYYKLDGVNLDDEYSGSPDTSNKWFTSKSSSAGARLAYELKMAMNEACYWPTEVSIFAYSTMASLPTVTENGVTVDQVEFVDQVLANYGSKGNPMGSTMGKDRCSGASMELNLGSNSLTASKAQAVIDGGYGWAMWFAFDPSGTGGVSNNRVSSMTQFNYASQAFYGCNVKEPQHVYHKLGEGKFDPTPHAIN